MTDTARRVREALSKHLSTAGRNKLPKSVPDMMANIPNLDEDRFYRLYHWLKEFTQKEDHLAYAALLQIWLNTCGLKWPKKVFAKGCDLESRGRGAPRRKDAFVQKVMALRSAGRSDAWIAGQLAQEFDQEKPSTKSRRTLADRLRKVKNVPPSLGGLDEPVLALGLKMLGKLTPEEYDEFLREVFRNRPDLYEAFTTK
jgi:hypothetical protein